LIVTGSADNTVKYWSIHNENGDQSKLHFNSLLVKSEPYRIWPVKINIEKYDSEDSFLIIVLCTNGYIYVNNILKIDDFKPILNSEENIDYSFETFNFKYKIKFSKTFKQILDARIDKNTYNEFDYEDPLYDEFSNADVLLSNRSFLKYSNKTLSAYLVTENNSNQDIKIYVKLWKLIDDKEYNSVEFEPIEFNQNYDFEFLNKKKLKFFNINQFEIIAFGLR
jgi:WD40 repeat protein